MGTLRIVHTHADGTLLEGSSKGDGVYEILKGLRGWRYFPSIRAIGIQQSRDHVAKRWLINAAADALRVAGHEVTVEIDDTPRARDEVLADQADRLDDRREALAARAERRGAECQSLRDRSHALVANIPPGQPYIVDSSGYAADRRRRERSVDLAIAAAHMADHVAEVERRAAAVGVAARVAETPRAAQERIKRLEAELRGIDRQLNGHERNFRNGNNVIVYTERHAPVDPASDHGLTLTARAAQIRVQLDHDRATVAAAVESGGLTVWDRKSVHAGDKVSQRSGEDARWHTVVRVNQVTVSVETGYSWTDKIPYTGIRQVRCPHGGAA